MIPRDIPSASARTIAVLVLSIALLAFTTPSAAHSAEQGSALAIAKHRFPEFTWKPPVLTGDFTCQGKTGFVMLGLSPAETLVVVFVDGLDHRPEQFRLPRAPEADNEMTISLSSLDISVADFRGMIGAVPDGFKRSKQCQGFSLSDGDTDPYNFYWDAKAKAFRYWRL